MGDALSAILEALVLAVAGIIIAAVALAGTAILLLLAPLAPLVRLLKKR